MLLAIEQGNTNTLFAVYDGNEWIAQWRTATDARLSRAVAAPGCIAARALIDRHCMTAHANIRSQQLSL